MGTEKGSKKQEQRVEGFKRNGRTRSRCKRPMQRARLWRRREEKRREIGSRRWYQTVVTFSFYHCFFDVETSSKGDLGCSGTNESSYDSIETRTSRLKQSRQKYFIVTIRKRVITGFIWWMGRIGMGKVGKPKGTMSESRSGWIESLIFHERWAWPCVIPYNSESNDVASGSSTRL